MEKRYEEGNKFQKMMIDYYNKPYHGVLECVISLVNLISIPVGYGEERVR